MLLIDPAASPPSDPQTNLPLERVTERLALLEAEVDRSNDTIVIPTPALAEILVGLGDRAPAVLDRLNRSGRFKIVDFDTRAAVEMAAMTREALIAGDKKGGSESPWQKIKIDRQIVAIARVMGVTRIYSDDSSLASFASKIGIDVVPTWKLPLPEPAPPSLFD